MTKFVYSRVVVIREFVNAWSPDRPSAVKLLETYNDDSRYSDNLSPNRDETLSTSRWEFVEETPGVVCAVCGKDILDRPVNLKPHTICRDCFNLARDIQEKMFLDIIEDLINDRPTTPAEKARTVPPEHTPH